MRNYVELQYYTSDAKSILTESKILFIEDVWDDVKELRDHNQERYDFNPEAWDEHEVNVGIFLTKILKIKVRNLHLYGKKLFPLC